jgi:hypothetical protein
MKKVVRLTAGLAAVAAAGLMLGGCNHDTPTAQNDAAALAAGAIAGADAEGGPRPRQTSVTPPFVKHLLSGVKAYALIGSDDVLPESPSYVFGGSADGAGLLRNADGTFTYLVNHEDNFAVSRISFDRKFAPVKGEYLLNSSVGLYRLCSATLATPEEHGFGPLFITAGESSAESQIHGFDPYGPPLAAPHFLTALGRWNTENAVPLPKQAYDRTVIVIGDDDSGPFGGQLALYVGTGIGDLQNGSLYALARSDDNIRERDMVVGQQYAVEFRQIPNQQSLTGAQINAKTAELKAVQFGRVEDIDYRKGGSGRELYFNVTGQDNSGVNASYGRSKYGRVYKLVLDAADPTRGTLAVVLDGDDRSGPAGRFQNVDNILVTENYAYVQEDANGYGDETHDAYIYQYDLNTRQVKVVMELDHRRTETDAAYYGSASSSFGSWEYGAMLDVSDQLGGNGDRHGTFLISIQPHTWRGAKYQNPDGGSVRLAENQASQVIAVSGLPR